MAVRALFKWVVELDKQGQAVCDFPTECSLYDIALEYVICDFQKLKLKTDTVQQAIPEVAYILLQTQYAPFKQLTYVRKNGALNTLMWVPSLRNFPVDKQATIYDFTHSLQYCAIDLRNDSQVLFKLADSNGCTLPLNATLSMSIVKRYRGTYES